MKRKVTLVLISVLVATLTAVSAQEQNQAPQVVAEIWCSPSVTLEGSVVDPENAEVTYQWRVVQAIEGSVWWLTGAETANPKFCPSVPGEYVLELTGSDGELETTDTVTVTVE